MDEEKAFWRKVFWSDDSKIELFGQNDLKCRGTLYHMLSLVVVAASCSGTDALGSADGIIKTLEKRPSTRRLTGRWLQAHIKAASGVDKAGFKPVLTSNPQHNTVNRTSFILPRRLVKYPTRILPEAWLKPLAKVKLAKGHLTKYYMWSRDNFDLWV